MVWRILRCVDSWLDELHSALAFACGVCEELLALYLNVVAFVDLPNFVAGFAMQAFACR
jgi:hypothetical protein